MEAGVKMAVDPLQRCVYVQHKMYMYICTLRDGIVIVHVHYMMVSL